MAEYIEREAVLDYIDHMPSELTSDGRRMIRRIRLTEYISDSIPAADVVPVVRCGECKLYGYRPWENGRTGICARTDIGVVHDDFCSYGMRKDGDGDV